jgi:hypothetical protein
MMPYWYFYWYPMAPFTVGPLGMAIALYLLYYALTYEWHRERHHGRLESYRHAGHPRLYMRMNYSILALFILIPLMTLFTIGANAFSTEPALVSFMNISLLVMVIALVLLLIVRYAITTSYVEKYIEYLNSPERLLSSHWESLDP